MHSVLRGCAMWATAAVLGLPAAAGAADDPLAWPAATRECRPWAYNWWMGSAVDRENLARELRRYREAGLGGIHVIPIYGAKGAESRYLPFLGSNWMAMLRFAVEEGARLDLGVDLTTGTGWCFGGPWVPTNYAASVFDANLFKVQGVVALKPGIRVKRAAPGGEGPMLDPFSPSAMDFYLTTFARAFDAPGAPKPRAMYHDSFEYRADWTPNLLAEFEKRRGYKLQDERDALFATVINDRAKRIRADYRETLSDLTVETFARWTAWCRKRGILTRNEAHGSPGNWLDLYALADIPETEMFGRGMRSAIASGFDGARFGEGDRDPLVSKFASSAAHVAGRTKVASETCTWMAEHFCETLEEAKCFMDRMFVSGVNHVFYHGTCYSPDDAAWPGWVFYASTQMNPRNSIWRDAPALNAYIARAQSVLQSGQPDNDVLLYWPLHDFWHHAGGLAVNMTVHSRDWLQREQIGGAARWLWERGYGFDYVSDRLLSLCEPGPDGTVAARGSAYRVVVVPATEHMPVNTARHLVRLARNGATIVFDQRLPADVPGMKNTEARRADLKAAFASLKFEPAAAGVQRAALYQGQVLVGPLAACMAAAPAAREPLADTAGVMLIRRRHEAGRHYFIANQGVNTVDGWVALGVPAKSAAVMDPMSGRTGWAESRANDGRLEVRMRLEPGASLMLRTFNERPADGAPWPPVAPGGVLAEVKGPWRVEFLSGGPALPKAYQAATAGSWASNGDPETVRFAGTAAYKATFDLAAAAKPGAGCLLDLGAVCHSARVRLNGADLGTLIMKPYRVEVPAGALKAAGNVLEVEVTNLSANRLRDLDRSGTEWRIFNDINIVGIDYKPLECAKWPLFDSGLLGPVRLLEKR